MRKAVGKLLFIYSIGFTFYVTANGMVKMINEGGTRTLLPSLLFLPIPLYFVGKLVKNYLVWRYAKPAGVEVGPDGEVPFKFSAFLSQDDAQFQITLGLLSLAISGTILRGLLSIYPESMTNNEWVGEGKDGSSTSSTDQTVLKDKLVDNNGLKDKLVYQIGGIDK